MLFTKEATKLQAILFCRGYCKIKWRLV